MSLRVKLRWSNVDRVLVLVVAVAAFLRFYRIGSQSLWFDEWHTTLVIDSVRHLFGDVAHAEGTPPLYFVLLKIWATVFGGGDGALRSLSALAGTLTVPVAYDATRHLAGSRRAGRVVAALIAVNPMLVWFSQEARAYSLLVLLAAVSLMMCIRARQDGETRTFVLWGVASAAALSTHYFALFLLLPEALWLAIALRDRWRAVASGVLPLAIVAPFLYVFFRAQREANLQTWITGTPLRFRTAEIGRQALIGPGGWEDRLWYVAAAVVVLAAVLVAALGDPTERRAAMLMFAIGAAGIVVPLVAARVGNDFMLPRNVIASLVPFGIAVGIGLGARRAGWAGLAGTLVICLLWTMIVLAVTSDPGKQRANWRALAHRLEAGSERRLVVVEHGAVLALPMRRYFHRVRSLGTHEKVRVREIDLVSHVSPGGGRCAFFQGRSCDPALFLLPDFPTSLANRFASFGKRTVDDFEVNLYRSSSPQPISAPTFGRKAQDGLLVLVVD